MPQQDKFIRLNPGAGATVVNTWCRLVITCQAPVAGTSTRRRRFLAIHVGLPFLPRTPPTWQIGRSTVLLLLQDPLVMKVARGLNQETLLVSES
jgi:hypothetical protein